jgi:hypothetical protein
MDCRGKPGNDAACMSTGGVLSRSILHAGNSGLFGTVGAAKGLALCLNPVADDAAAAMGTPGRHGLDGTFEAVERHAPLTLSDNDRLVIVVSTYITHRHMIDLSVRFAPGRGLPLAHHNKALL